MANRLLDVQAHGQSIWYDNISRDLIESGELERLVREDGVRGVTSNPAIFEKAIGGSSDYDEAVRKLVDEGVGDVLAIFERLAIEDIQRGCEILRPVYDESDGADGFVSLEVSPYLAHDTEATVAEALRLWSTVGRDNLMIKVPGTPAGVPAIARLIAQGVNVNVTLLFSVASYEAVAGAYLDGLEQIAASGGDVSRVASVASFFVSRIDAAVGKRIARKLEEAGASSDRAALEALDAKAAIANAKLAYAHYLALSATPRWQALAARGARPQRLLWASTGTKSPDLPKTLYVDSLIGPDTVNTVPTATFQAFKSEGIVRNVLGSEPEANLASARELLGRVAAAGIDFNAVTDELLDQGCQLFCDAFDELLGAVARKREDVLGDRLAQLTCSLGEAQASVEEAIEDWRAEGNVRRLWNGDATLWSGADEASWLGWLRILDDWKDDLRVLHTIAERTRGDAIDHVVVMGMGGSSLCPDVLRRTFGAADGYPTLHVLDSTVPAQIRTLESQIDVERSLFIVPSKSGGTIEPNSFKAYFWERAGEAAAARFIAITDPGTKLDELAKAEGFSQIAYGVPSIGGRFSALSAFGMVPAAALGIDFEDFLARTRLMVDTCGAFVPPAHNPGVRLGLVLGTLARQGRDKLTIAASPDLEALGGWLEQLIAESTGKHDRGIVPVDGESLAAPGDYGRDRVFAYIRSSQGASKPQDEAIAALERAGQPVVRIDLADPRDLGQEFFRWEIATAVAGAVLGINPFDQPDVEAAKIAARRLMEKYEESGALPSHVPFLEEAGLALHAGEHGARTLAGADLEACIAAHLARLAPGDYFAINAYIEMNEAHDEPLQAIRHLVRDATGVATTVGYGPRFLHSTGQLHKGGPNRGVFLQITSDDAEDLPIPGQRYSFGVLKNAQAEGDFAVLVERDRRALRVHLGEDVSAGLKRLEEIVRNVLEARDHAAGC